MKIVLDLQAAQSHSRHRGIGRYSLSMARAFAACAGKHELWLSLNGHYPEEAEAIIEALSAWIPPQRVRLSHLPAGIEGCHGAANAWQQGVASAGYAAFLRSFQADLVWHASLFEGWADRSALALGDGCDDGAHIATFYDLIPLLRPGDHLRDPGYRQWYYQRLALLKRCGLLLALSQSSRREAREVLQIPDENIAVVLGAPDACFRPMPVHQTDRQRWQQQWALTSRFLMYAGGFESHKNVETLLQAFALVPQALRQDRMLLIAGRCPSHRQQSLEGLARRLGLSLGFTGAIEDQDLARLYSACELFVAPSLHEGLGLPPLEAMACGAAVIGSNTTSLPEVLGEPAAMFDARSPSAMAEKIGQVLGQPDFHRFLRQRATAQAARFTWQASAQAALQAIEAYGERRASARRSSPIQPCLPAGRPRLLYVSPLPPARSGIADYSARLLRELAVHYQVELVVEQVETTDPWLQANFPLRSLAWFEEHAGACERRLYHFGNSPYHAHMFDLLQRFPGVVMLHDSWLGAVRNWMAHQQGKPDHFLAALHADHGVAALDYERRHGRAATLDRYSVNLDVIASAQRLLVHSRYAVEQARRFHGDQAAAKFRQVPFPKALTSGDRSLARRLLGLAEQDLVVASFGMVAPTKLSHRLLDAWLASPLTDDPRCHLLLVGENDGGDYGQALQRRIAAQGRGRVRITGYVDAQQYADALAAADIAVQLRTDSRGETSAAVFDALAEGLPLVVNAHGTAAELDASTVYSLPDRFDDEQLAQALEELVAQPDRRRQLGERARVWIAQHHAPARAAADYALALEDAVVSSPGAADERLRHQLLARFEGVDRTGAPWAELMAVFPANQPRVGRPRLWVDVTATARNERHTGIERVVRGVLRALLETEETLPWQVEPVRLTAEGYVTAPAFGLGLLGLPDSGLPSRPVNACAGDLLLGLDWVADLLPQHANLLRSWRLSGVRQYFVVYDLLPVLQPDWFPPTIASMHARWLDCIGSAADGLLAISGAVTDELRRWFDDHPPRRRAALPLGYFHPGHDLAAAAAVPASLSSPPEDVAAMPQFLMVGTVEPRKGHALALQAFERLWQRHRAVQLVIVGKLGWMSEALAQRLHQHVRDGHPLIWLQDADDTRLQALYRSSTALLAASAGEGFGLPLVEAAHHGLPILARDIPVFREVAGDQARYFPPDPQALADALDQWLDDPLPRGPVTLPAATSWGQTTDRLVTLLQDPHAAGWQAAWQRPGNGGSGVAGQEPHVSPPLAAQAAAPPKELASE